MSFAALLGQNDQTEGGQLITLSGSYTYDGTAKTPTVGAAPSNPAGYPIVSGSKTNAGTYDYTQFSITPFGGYSPITYSGNLVINAASVTLSSYISCTFYYDGSGYFVFQLGALATGSDWVQFQVNLGGSIFYQTLYSNQQVSFYGNSYYGPTFCTFTPWASNNNNYYSNSSSPGNMYCP